MANGQQLKLVSGRLPRRFAPRNDDFYFAVAKISPLYRTDAKPRAEIACKLCRGAKEEDRRSKGVWGIGNTKGGGLPPLY